MTEPYKFEYEYFSDGAYSHCGKLVFTHHETNRQYDYIIARWLNDSGITEDRWNRWYTNNSISIYFHFKEDYMLFKLRFG